MFTPSGVGTQLACARIGAVHSVVFAGFSAEALSGRILDSRPRVVLTTSAVKRGAKPISLKALPHVVNEPKASAWKGPHGTCLVQCMERADELLKRVSRYVAGTVHALICK